ncbi:TIGR02530 family flagellar biosynthesis protein [Inediibacterium massiliense]|uniref:TIGR02530 family flagellar biosynthesis protein n=1 Tax=Inediibacterium massiliense TaxID=1658111 RepID=UPI000AFA9F60|nr:TIGR02530 family flagellar biosynthesis protein [Inediibacterium massiliense]
MNKMMIHHIRPQINQTVSRNKPISKGFDQVLNQEINKEVKFSKHAVERLESRNIKIHPNEMTKINEAVSKANQKGIKEALILMDNKAFVASVKNKTIITVATNEQLKENIFTNIDGAVII